MDLRNHIYNRYLRFFYFILRLELLSHWLLLLRNIEKSTDYLIAFEISFKHFQKNNFILSLFLIFCINFILYYFKGSPFCLFYQFFLS